MIFKERIGDVLGRMVKIHKEEMPRMN